MKLTPEDVARLETKELANVIRKLNAGGTLTGPQRAILAQARGAGVDGAAEPAAAAFVSKWEDLARAASIDRRTLTNARQRFAAEIKERGAELTRADGHHNVAAWIAFLDEKGVRGRGINNPATTPDDYIDERQLRLKREKVRLDREEFELAKAKEAMLPCSEYETALAQMVGAFNVVLNQLPGRATGKLVTRARAGLLDLLRETLTPKQFEKAEALFETTAIDYADIEEILRAEMDLARRTLAECEFLREGGARDKRR